MADVFKKSGFWNVAGIIAALLAISYNLGKTLESASTKTFALKDDTKGAVQSGLKSINSYAAAVEKNPFGIKGVRFSVIDKKSGETGGADPKGFLLKGVITLYPGYAFIESKDNPQKLFKIGEDVFGAGKLKLVNKESVYIADGGKGFELLLAGSVKNPPGRGGELKKNEGVSSVSSDTKKQSGVKEKTFQKEEIKRFLDNPKEILTDARLLPNLKDGKQEGFIVREVKPGGFYENIGLVNGDIILRANGIELASPGDGVKIFSMIKELDKVELDIIRNGVRTTQVYHIN